MVEVRFGGDIRKIPASQLELRPAIPETAVDLIARGNVPDPSNLRRKISHVRLSGNLADVFYSMETSDTDFYAHQFKPVVKVLDSPSGNLLIADEVGLGKTIEAGLVWNELAARFKYNRLVVVCPKVLCEKWKSELGEKFGIDARICDARDLVETLKSRAAAINGFAVICGMQSIRPRPQNKRTGRPVDKLAELLEESVEGDRLFDVLIVDEAHHMRNPESATATLGRLLSGVTEHLVLLTATPINLRNRDLHSLLKMIDPLSFQDETALEQIIRANRPLVAAREAVLRGDSADEVFQHLLEASRNPILRDTRQLQRLVGEIKVIDAIDKSARAGIAKRLEKVNQLSNVINRTRRRDVEELRVTRKVEAYRTDMHPDERELYDAITLEVVRFSIENDMPTGFLTVMPQRMLASSLPAALRHWQGDAKPMDLEDEQFEIEEDDFFDEERPLRGLLNRISRKHPDWRELAAIDTKFSEFLDVLKSHLKETPTEKFVVFSAFRATLSYLEERLKNEGISTIALNGGTEDRQDVVHTFRDDPSLRVLLTSEVGSEGIDLQFARTLINYDLPWNPMRVEQRIGRIDRLGQDAPTISVLNLLHRNTIDERIYHRLHERLRLCHNALGGFEEILGTEILSLENDILRGKLTDQEIEERMQQTEQAIENRLEEEKALESEAAALFAHGDYILQSIQEARAGGDWITDRDTVDYVRDALGLLSSGSKIHWDDIDGLLSVELSPEARFKFIDWCESRKLSANPFGGRAQIGRFKLGVSSSRERLPRLSATHPFMRFLSLVLEENQGVNPVATAITVPADQVEGLEPGIYVGAVEEWRFGSGVTSTYIAFSLAAIGSNAALPDDLSDRLGASAIKFGKHWTLASEEVDFSEAAAVISSVLEDNLNERFEDEREKREVIVEDRIEVQMATLRNRTEIERRKFQHTIFKAGKRLEAANRARLGNFEDRVKIREQKILAQGVANSTAKRLAAFVLEVQE